MSISVNQKKLTLYWLASLSLTYLIWQFIGLRFTNHDDIFIHLASFVFAGDYLGFANYAANAQSRIQAFINMPIILWVNHLQANIFYDVFNLSVFLGLLLSICWVFSQLSTISIATGFTILLALVFPIHYYFTFPQSYPVMGAWPLTFLFLSLGFYSSYLKNPKKLKFLTSVLLFASSLFGAEYNFILHPILLLIVAYSGLRTPATTSFFKVFSETKFFILVWLLSFLLYWSYSFYARDKGLDTVGRMTLNFSLFSLVKTFWVLQIKSFLPLALVDGIKLVDLSELGGPNVPNPLRYSSIYPAFSDSFSVSMIFVLFILIFLTTFASQTKPSKVPFTIGLMFCSILIIPCFVVSASTHYQEIVLKGYIQGHLVSFYSQVGFTGLAFLISIFLVSWTSNKVIKSLVIFALSILFAGWATFTFVYNNMNRQLMMANLQKWEAVNQLADYIYLSNPDLKDKSVLAPNLWLSTGVSTIPDVSPFSGMNYWSEYSEKVLRKPLQFVNAASPDIKNFIEADLILNRTGDPIIVLREKIDGSVSDRLLLISKKPVEGQLIYSNPLVTQKQVSLTEWDCAQQCIFSTNVMDSIVSFKPTKIQDLSLVEQFLLERFHGFAFPVS